MTTLGYDDEQAALASSVAGFCERHVDEQVVREPLVEMPTSWWTGLADLGVLALGTEEGGGGPLEIAAACEQLGRFAVPGPFASSFVASHLLAPAEREGLVGGKSIAAVAVPPIVPFGAIADTVIEVAEGQAWLAELRSEPEEVETTAGEPWARVELDRVRLLGDAAGALAVGDLALGAYLAGAGRALLDLTSTYAADRHQFHKPIGDFQAVAHPLADGELRLRAAGHLVRTAARELASADDAGSRLAGAAAAATARVSATRAALRVAYVAHQTYGAMGFTVEGPVAPFSHRIRQVSLHLPGPDRLRAAVLAAHDLPDREDHQQGGPP